MITFEFQKATRWYFNFFFRRLPLRYTFLNQIIKWHIIFGTSLFHYERSCILRLRETANIEEHNQSARDQHLLHPVCVRQYSGCFVAALRISPRAFPMADRAAAWLLKLVVAEIPEVWVSSEGSAAGHEQPLSPAKNIQKSENQF